MSQIRNMFEVYCREFKLVKGDVGIILFFLFLPLAYPIIYSLIYNPELVKNVSMVIVDHDRTPLSREVMRKMNATDQAQVIGYAADLNEARRAINTHEAFAILEIPEGFERSVGRHETGNAVMYCDMSLLLRYRGFLVASTNVMADFSTELMTETIDNIAPLAETVVSGDLMPVENISMGNIRNGFDSFIMPGVLILILQQCIILAVGMAGGAQREKMLYTGHSSDSLRGSTALTMIAQSLCYLTVLIIPIIFLLHYVPLIFRFPMEGDNLEIFAYILPMVIASLGMGFTLQSLVTEREAVFVIWVATSLIFLLLSGLIWPLYDMYPAWRYLSYLCPATWGVEGYVKMNANGASLSQLGDIYRNLWILAAVWSVLGWCSRKFVVRPALRRAQMVRGER